MQASEMCKVPVVNQLRAKGLRMAKDYEVGERVECLRNEQDATLDNPDMYPKPVAFEVMAVELETKIDPIMITLLVGFSDVCLTNATDDFQQMCLGLVDYSERIGATEQEIRLAIERIRRERRANT